MTMDPRLNNSYLLDEWQGRWAKISALEKAPTLFLYELLVILRRSWSCSGNTQKTSCKDTDVINDAIHQIASITIVYAFHPYYPPAKIIFTRTLKVMIRSASDPGQAIPDCCDMWTRFAGSP